MRMVDLYWAARFRESNTATSFQRITNMPTATGKGKVPLSQVKEYDPHHDASPGMPREKKPKGTSKSMVMNHKVRK
jgi:hypothetical protein